MKSFFKIITISLIFIFFIIPACKKQSGDQKEKEPLKVLANLPQGEEVPLTTEGITVMFNQAMIPLTTLDKGRDQAIALTIEPKTPGKFFWLGTKGFIFRPAEPFLPATTYKITLPSKIKSIQGNRIEQELVWEFTTVRPQVINLSPYENDELLPHQVVFSIQFNLAMNKKEVEQKLQILDSETKKPIKVKKELAWFEEDHRLLVKPKEKLPYDKQIILVLPKDLHAQKGTMGLLEDFTRAFETLPSKFSLKGVFLGSDYNMEDSLDPFQETLVPAGESICYHFTQPITEASFKGAFTVWKVKDKQKTKIEKPYFYYRDYYSYPKPTQKNPYEMITGYAAGCVTFSDQFDQRYEFVVDYQKLKALSLAQFKGTKQTYAIKSDHASSRLASLLTQQILNPKISTQVPYKIRNLKKGTIRLYQITDKDNYSESIKNHVPSFKMVWDENLKTYVFAESHVSQDLPGTQWEVPLDRLTGTIDQMRMGANWIEEFNFESNKIDEEEIFKFDLATLNQGQGLQPGLYLAEMYGTDRFGDENNPSASTVGPILTAFQISNISLAMKRELDHALVWATQIENGQPVTGLSIKTFLKKDNGEIFEAQAITNDQGVAILKGNFSGTDLLKGSTYDTHLCALVDDPINYSLACERDHQISSYRSLLTPGPHYDTFIHTDRPLYRPGQTVYFSSFIREVREGRYFTPAEGMQFSVSVENSAYENIYSTENSSLESGGILRGQFTIENSKETPRGPYRIIIYAGAEGNRQRFEKIFTVASYKKPSFKIDLKSLKPEIMNKQTLEVEVLGSYFFGAPLRKSNGSWSMMTTTYDFSPEGYEAFSFIDSDLLYVQENSNRYSDYEGEYYSDYEYDSVGGGSFKEDEDHYQGQETGSENQDLNTFFKDKDGNEIKMVKDKTNDQGLFKIVYSPDLKKYPTSQVINIEANIQDPSNQEVSGSTNVIVHKGNFYLGLSPQKWVYGENEVAKFDLVTLDTEGKIVPNQNFSAKIVRREYQYIERMNAQGYWEYIDEKKDTVIKTLTQKTNTEGTSTIEFQIPQGGEYRVILEAKDNLENSIQSASSIYAWGKGYVAWKMNEKQELELVPDKENYQVGETAKILIKSLMPVTKALFTLERGRILEYKVIELGGNANHIEIPITEGMTPNLYVSVVAHTGDHLLFYGETEVNIATQTKKLNLELTADHQNQTVEGSDTPLPIYRPGEKVKVKVKTTDHLGEPLKTHVIIAAADESVLRMLNFKLPDLIKYFYYNRINSVLTSSNLSSLKSGDGGPGQTRKDFRDTAFFEANLITNEKGEAEFEFTLPDDLTTWVIDGLAISESKTLVNFENERASKQAPSSQNDLDNNLVLSDGTWMGSTRTRVMSTLPVLIRGGLPRFVAWEDEVNAKVILNNRLNTPIEGTVVVELGETAQFNNQQQTVELPFTLEAMTEKSLSIPFKVTKNFGKLFLKAQVFDKNKKFIDGFENYIPIEDRYAPEVVATSGMTEDKTLEQIDIPESIINDKGALKISFKASLGLAMANPMRDLMYYPYGCSEQKSARLLGMLMVRDLINLYGDTYLDILSDHQKSIFPKNKSKADHLKILEDEINQTLNDLIDKHQNSDGGFKYWPEDNESTFYASSQVLWALVLTKTLPFAADVSVVAQLKNYITKEIYKADVSLDTKAYGLWTLSLADQFESPLAEQLIKEHINLSISGLSYLLAAIPNSDVYRSNISLIENRLKTLAKHESRHIQWPESNFFWSSTYKNTALATYSLLTHNADDPFIQKGLTFLINQKKANPPVETQNSLYKAWLGYQLAKVKSEEKTNFKSELTLAKKELLKATFNLQSLLKEEKKQIPIAEISKTKMPADIEIKKEGEGTLYYDLEFLYYLPPNQTPPREEGLVISREYYALEDVKEEHPLTEFEAGQTYKGVLTLLVPKELNYILIEELLPAGFDPIDATLATSSNAARLMANQIPDDTYAYDDYRRYHPYDDVFVITDYSTDYTFTHQEIRDDSIIWSDKYVPPGKYTIRYPVRATTEGSFTLSGARAFEFYEPEIFGRSRARRIVIKSSPPVVP